MNIVPKPYLIEPSEGSFAFRADMKVRTSLPVIADMFGGAAETSPIIFRKADTEWDYVLKITPSGVEATASDDEGLFHAAVTLRQLTGGKKEADIPAWSSTNRVTLTARECWTCAAIFTAWTS